MLHDMAGEVQSRHGWVALSYFFLGALFGLVVTTISLVVAVISMIASSGEALFGAFMSAAIGAGVLYFHLTEGLKRSQVQAASIDLSTAPPPPPAGAVAEQPAGRAPLWPAAVYFRFAALIGLIVAVSGAISVTSAIASALFGNDLSQFGAGFTTFPGAIPGFSTTGESFARGLLTTGIGVLIMWWHLTEARKREY
jgi:hypothetical protein